MLIITPGSWRCQWTSFTSFWPWNGTTMISKYGTITKAWIDIHRSVLERAFGKENRSLQFVLKRESSWSVSMSEQQLARILANCLRGIKLVSPNFQYFWEVLHVSQWRWRRCSSSSNGSRQYYPRAFYILIAYHVNKQQLRWYIQMPSFSFCIVVSLYCQIPQGHLIIWTRSCKHGAVCRMPLDWRDGSRVVLEHCYCYTAVRKKHLLNEYRIVPTHKSCVHRRTQKGSLEAQAKVLRCL